MSSSRKGILKKECLLLNNPNISIFLFHNNHSASFYWIPSIQPGRSIRRNRDGCRRMEHSGCQKSSWNDKVSDLLALYKINTVFLTFIYNINSNLDKVYKDNYVVMKSTLFKNFFKYYFYFIFYNNILWVMHLSFYYRSVPI